MSGYCVSNSSLPSRQADVRFIELGDFIAFHLRVAEYMMLFLEAKVCFGTLLNFALDRRGLFICHTRPSMLYGTVN